MYATSKRGLYLLFKTYISFPNFIISFQLVLRYVVIFKLGFLLFARISLYYATQLLVLLGQYCTELSRIPS